MFIPEQVRLNADTLASNGSSSMSAVCAGSLALQAAGLQLRDGLTAGVAIGLISALPPVETARAGGASSVSGDSSSNSSSGSSSSPPAGESDWFNDDSERQQELLVDIQVGHAAAAAGHSPKSACVL